MPCGPTTRGRSDESVLLFAIPSLKMPIAGRDEDEGVRKRSNSASGQPLPVNFSYLELQETELKDFACDP